MRWTRPKKPSINDKCMKLKRWKTCFAWLPHETREGETLWLEKIARRAASFKWSTINADVQNWEYTTPEIAAVEVLTAQKESPIEARDFAKEYNELTQLFKAMEFPDGSLPPPKSTKKV